ncbi:MULTISPECIES: hypothetical protein [Cupriavidus]|uniref:hypothetical protein n=1 Tax=Cupriavidus TaxID=106589 RepID=UPI001428B603|nr:MULTISPECIES: hypothetical protein [Cupriavidus]
MNRSTRGRLAAVIALALCVLAISACERDKPGPGPQPISGQPHSAASQPAPAR